MKKHENSRANPQHIKRKLMSAVAMLLISAIMMSVTSYAWLVMSIAPEVSGMTANVGANGSLEIALLNSQTREDLSRIPSMDGSLASRDPGANNSWGNILDLSYTTYGLQDMILWPARLNLIQTGDGYVVDSGLLSVPTYGFDGRIVELIDDTVSGTFDGDAFTTVIGVQDYGVRAIGTADSLSVQGSSLALAKSNIKTYMNSANSAAVSAMESSGNNLMTILMNRDSTYDDSDLEVLKSMINSLQNSLDYIELALRQGMVGVAASIIANEGTFNSVKDEILNDSNSLTDLIETLKESYEIDEGYTTWINELKKVQNNLDAAQNACNALTDGEYTWAEFKAALDYLMNVDKVYINDDIFTDFDTSKAQELLEGDVVILLADGSGVFADIANFAGDIESWVNYLVDIQITTATKVDPVYLQAMSNLVNGLEPADGGDSAEAAVELSSTYGYAVDMAFRTNAAVSNLLLQTAATQRVYDGSENARTMGGGSYMEFTTDDEDFALKTMLELMDAVRVAFIDDQGNLLGIAKLNTSNRVVDGEKVRAPLYLYSFHIDEDDGSLQMDERQKANNVLTPLEQNVPKAVSAVVWLDGDLVDNTMVSDTEETSLRGILNLQFASSANLVAGNNNALINISADKSGLESAISEETERFNAGKLTWTTSSWDAFSTAYNNAVAVNANPAATEYQIYMSVLALKTTASELAVVSEESLDNEIAEMRQVMGTSEDILYMVSYDEESGEYIIYDSQFTEEQKDNSVTIYRVDYNNNLNDEGNGVYIPIYTDESWTALAAALYEAEKLRVKTDVTNDELDDAIIAMETAYDALERTVYYVAYEFEGATYYMAISDETDTYGKWYDNSFKRIVNDLTILKLDAQAELANLGEISQNLYISNRSGFVTPYIEFYDEVFTDVDFTMKALMWNLPDQFSLAMTAEQSAALNNLVEWAQVVEEPVDDKATTDDDALYADKLEYFKKAQGMIATAQRLLNRNNATSDEAETVVLQFGALKLDYEWFVEWNSMTEEEREEYLEENAKEYMTADQITVLTVASNAGKSVAGYDDAENKDLDALRAAVKAVDDALAASADDDATNNTTSAQAISVLNTLNQELEELGQNPVTAYNTLTFQIPVSSDTYEVVYSVQNNPMSGIVVNSGTGDATIKAVVLLESGVVFTLTKDVVIYSPAGSAEITYEAASVPAGGLLQVVEGVPSWFHEDAWDGRIQIGETLELSAGLVCRQEPVLDTYGMDTYIEHELMNVLGTVIATEKEYLFQDIAHTEKIQSYTWATDNMDILEVLSTDNDMGTCRLLAKADGEVNVTVTVETEQGNVYAAQFPVVVRSASIVGDDRLTLEETAELSVAYDLVDGAEYEYTWTVSDSDVLELTGADKAVCQIKALSSGVVNVSLKIVEKHNIVKNTAEGSVDEVRERVLTTNVVVRVNKYPIETATVKADKTSVNIGESINLTTTVAPVGENYATPESYEWSADTEGIVELIPNGSSCIAQAIGEGSVTLTVRIAVDEGIDEPSYLVRNIIVTVVDPTSGGSDVTEPSSVVETTEATEPTN